MRLIDADALANRIWNEAERYKGTDGFVWVRRGKIGLLLAEAPVVDAVPVVRCEKCVLHGNCTTEDAFVFAGIDNPFCCSGKWKEGADND